MSLHDDIEMELAILRTPSAIKYLRHEYLRILNVSHKLYIWPAQPKSSKLYFKLRYILIKWHSFVL